MRKGTRLKKRNGTLDTPKGQAHSFPSFFLNFAPAGSFSFWTNHQWLFQISMKLPSAKIELGPIYDRLVHKFSFSGHKMRLPGLKGPQKLTH